MTPAQRPPPSIDPDQLTENFHLREFTRSDTARELGIDNRPATAEHRSNLKRHAQVLESIRRWAGGRRVTIHSGYRSPALNAAVKGVANSDHCQGDASDITIEGLTARASAQMIAKMVAEGRIKVDQVILETSRGVVHVSTAPRLRGQILTQAGGPGSPVAKGIIGG